MDLYNFSEDRLRTILEKNKNKIFVDRILNANKYPTLDLGKGNYATHKMTWMEVDGKYHVFPTVLYNGKTLKEYDPKTAYKIVRDTGNYIEFDTPEEADWFSKKYKTLLQGHD